MNTIAMTSPITPTQRWQATTARAQTLPTTDTLSLSSASRVRFGVTQKSLYALNNYSRQIEGIFTSSARPQAAFLQYREVSERISLANLDFSHANLAQKFLIKANLQGANMASADLSHADMTGSDLRGATLTNARLEGWKFAMANFEGADLKGAHLENVITDPTLFLNTIADQSTTWPKGWQVELEEGTGRVTKITVQTN